MNRLKDAAQRTVADEAEPAGLLPTIGCPANDMLTGSLSAHRRTIATAGQATHQFGNFNKR
jgi:hypothetical protein